MQTGKKGRDAGHSELWRDVKTTEAPLSSEGSKPHIVLSSPGDVHWEDKPPYHLSLKMRGLMSGRSGGLLWEALLETLLLKGLHTNSLTLSLNAEVEA